MDDLFTCPYDKSHRILRHRLARHLIKCKRNYPDSEIRICPFNTEHHTMGDTDMVTHITICPNGVGTSHWNSPPGTSSSQFVIPDIEDDGTWNLPSTSANSSVLDSINLRASISSYILPPLTVGVSRSTRRANRIARRNHIFNLFGAPPEPPSRAVSPVPCQSDYTAPPVHVPQRNDSHLQLPSQPRKRPLKHRSGKLKLEKRIKKRDTLGRHERRLRDDFACRACSELSFWQCEAGHPFPGCIEEHCLQPQLHKSLLPPNRSCTVRGCNAKVSVKNLVMRDFYDRIRVPQCPSFQEIFRKVIKCPVCSYIAEPPFLQCSNGHFMCGLCIQAVQNTQKPCPYCKQGDSLYLNDQLEMIYHESLHEC